MLYVQVMIKRANKDTEMIPSVSPFFLFTNYIIFVDQQLLNIFVLFLITTNSKIKTQYHVSRNS